MIPWLVVAAYALLGVGVSRIVYSHEYATLCEDYVNESGYTLARAREKASQEDGGFLAFVVCVALFFWPLVFVWLVLLRPLGTVIGPLLSTWWRMPVERALKARGLK